MNRSIIIFNLTDLFKDIQNVIELILFQTFHTPNFGDEEFDIPNINHQQQQQQQHAQQGHNDQQQHYQPPMQVIEFCYFNLIFGSF